MSGRTIRSPRSSKWVTGLSPELSVSDAARVTIQQRLQSVVEFLPLAAKHSEDDLEFVHQLRVSTRRSTAALDLFDTQLPHRRRRHLRQQLRQIRRAAGAARDLDVMLIRFRREENESGDRRFRKIIGNLEARRRKAQRALVDVHRRLKDAVISKTVRAIVSRVRWRSTEPEPSFQCCAVHLLEMAASKFFLAVRLDSDDPESLHEMRLEAKCLRYTAEVVAPAFDAPFRQRFYPELVELQDALGRISDHQAVSRLFARWSDKTAGGRLMREVARQEKAAIKTAIGRLHEEWPGERIGRLQQAVNDQISTSATRN